MRISYVDRLLQTLADHPDREALIHGEQRISSAEAHALVLRLAAALTQRGVRTADGVAVFGGNRPETVLVGLAVHLIGAQLVFVPPETMVTELLHYLRRAAPVALVYDPRLPIAIELAEQTETAMVLSLGPAGVGEDLLTLADEQPAEPPAHPATRDDIVTLFYTGGTTSMPKMVLHRHSYYDGLIFSSDRRRAECPVPQRFLICTRLLHSSGHIMATVALLAGGTAVIADFDAGEVIAAMIRERITSVVLVPPMLYAVLDHPDCPAEGFADLVKLHYGAAPTTPTRIRQALERFGPVLRQTYGLTEAPVVTTMEPEQHDLTKPERLASCGKPLAPLVEVRLERGGEEVPLGEIGEVCVRGPLVMAEYRNDPERTEDVLKDGWLHTGDLGRLDADGYLYLVDRAKDVIITGVNAANVYSTLIEDVLTRHPGVRMAAAVGLADLQFGEVVHAACVLAPDANVDESVLCKEVLEELGPLYEPRRIVFVPELPCTAVGKIDKKAVRAMLSQSLV